jgi:hypothetical protein
MILICFRFATSVVLTAAYGFRITDDDDPYVKLASKVAWIFSHGGPPGATLVDILPISELNSRSYFL